MKLNIETFRTYINYYDSGDEVDSLLDGYIQTAKSIVENYLGYPLGIHHYDMSVLPTHQEKIFTNVSPILNVCNVSSGDDYIYDYEISHDKTFLYRKGGWDFNSSIHIEYHAGTEEIPDIVVMTIYRIGALLYSEQEGNIGVTGTSSETGGSRTFVNYTNFDKYLRELRPFKGHYF